MAYPPGPERMVALPAYGANSAPTDRFWIASAAVGFAAGSAADRYITPNDFLAEITRNISDVSLQFGNGAGISTVSDPNKGKLRYSATGQSFQVSENGGAYTNLLKGSGIATRAAFWSGTSTLSSNANFYWDNVNDRLGIGVGSTPGAPVDVLADGTALAQQWRQNAGPMRVQLILDNVPETSFGTSTNHTLHLLTNNLQRLTVENGGLVGINKSSLVQAQLQVVSIDAITPTLFLNSANTPTANIAEFYNDNSLRFAFDPSANLAIGLAGASGETGSISFAVNGQANLTTLRAGAAPISQNTLWLPSDDPAAGEFLKVTSFTANDIVTEWAAAGGVSGSGVATRAAFWSGTSTLSSNANFYWDNVNERLGIGVGSTPGAPVDVLADGTALAQQWRQNAGPMRAQLVLDNVPETSFGTSTNHTLHLLTNNLQRLTVENGGLVGINKSSVVQAQLQVVSIDAITPTLFLNSANTPTVNIAEFYNDNSLRFAFDPSANLAIGLAGASGATGSISFAVNGQANLTTLRAGSAPVSQNTLWLPSDDPAAGEFLKVTSFTANDIVTEWAAGGGTPGSPVNSIQYNNAGAFGGISTFTTDGTVVTMTRAGIGTTFTDGIILTNTTAAAAGAQQYSPLLRLTGFGWKTNATAASQQTDWGIQAQPVQGAAAPTVNLVFLSQINTGGFAQQFSVTSGAIAQIGTTGGTLYFGNSNHLITASDASNTMSFAPSGGTTAMSLTANFLRIPQASGADAAGIQGLAANGNNDISFFPQPRGGNTGTGGSLYIHGGTGSTSGTPSVGGNAHLYGGAGGTNQNGGNAYIYGGALNGAGANGDVYLGYNGSSILGAIFIQGTDLAFVRSSASLLRVTNGSTGLGSVLIGTSTDSLTGNFTVMSSNAATNSLVTVARLGVNSTGTAADGFGASLSWSAETSTTNDQETGRINVFWTTATHAIRTSAISWSTVNSGTLSPVMRLGTPSNSVGSPFVLTLHGGTNPNVWTAGAFAAKIYLIDPTLPATGVAAHFSNTGSEAPAWQLLRGRGTNASPTAIQNSDRIGQVQFAGQTSTSTNNFAIGAEIRVSATENWSAGNNGCTMFFRNANNAGTITDRMQITETGTVRISASSGSYSTTTLLQVGNYASWSTSVVAAIYSGANGSVPFQLIGTNGQTANMFEVFRDSLTPNLLTLSAPGVLGLRAGLNTGTLQARVGGVIHQDYTPVDSGGGGVETTLMSFSLPANLLGSDSDRVVMHNFGAFVAPTGAARLRVYFGATVVYDSTSLAFTSSDWNVETEVARTTSTDQLAVSVFDGDLTLVTENVQLASPTETASGTILVKVTAETVLASEAVQLGSVIAWHPAAA